MAKNTEEDVMRRIYDPNLYGRDVLKRYNEYAKSGLYDSDMSSADHQGRVMLADELEMFYPTEQREHVTILDIGAGTGRVAEELRRRGYTNIDALEPASEMLKIARSRGLYRTYMCAAVSDQELDIQEGFYDVICSVGTISSGYIPAVAIHEMVRLTKSGGIIAIVGRHRNWQELPEYHHRMNGLIHQLEKEGRIKILKQEARPGYMFRNRPNSESAIFIFLQKSA